MMMRRITGVAFLSAAILLPGGGSVVTASPETAETARVARRVTIPAGTVLRLRVDRGLDPTSRVSRIPCRRRSRERSSSMAGRSCRGSTAAGYVSEAVRPGKVKGRGRVAVRFTRIDPGPGVEPYRMQTRSWVAVAPATKKKDALTIGIPAAGGAVVGALVGGKKGAGIGAAAGGGAGTAVVLTTRGKDVRVGRGAVLSVRLYRTVDGQPQRVRSGSGERLTGGHAC